MKFIDHLPIIVWSRQLKVELIKKCHSTFSNFPIPALKSINLKFKLWPEKKFVKKRYFPDFNIHYQAVWRLYLCLFVLFFKKRHVMTSKIQNKNDLWIKVGFILKICLMFWNVWRCNFFSYHFCSHNHVLNLMQNARKRFSQYASN